MNVTKLILYLEAQADCTYPDMYHRKLHGAILNRIPDPIIERSKQREVSTLGVSFTELVPWGDVTAGETRELVVNTVNPEVVGHIAQSVSSDPTFDIGEMQFTVQGIDQSTVDVGEVGTRGTLESDTGVLVSIPNDRVAEFGIENSGDEVYYWSEDDPEEVFTRRISENLAGKWRTFANRSSTDNGTETAGVSEAIHGPLFTRKTLQKTYSIPLRVSRDHTQRIVLSKWEFEYEVRNQAHREILNLALGAGIGERNSFGLGTLSLTSKQEPFLTGA